MKQIYLFLSLVLLCACSGSDEELSTVAQQPCPALELTVSAGGFVTDGSAPGTRATDNGAATTFENNDRVGVIVLEGGTLKGNNLPYKYNGGSWSFDAATVGSENTSKSVYYYDNKATKVTYIVYFPYSADADGVTSLDGDGGLKSKFIPKADQQSEAGYRASDLMVWISGSGSPQKTLAATLTHAYNSVSLLPEVHYTLEDGQDFVHPSPAISGVNFIMNDKIVYPYKAADGSYRYILPSGLTNKSVRCFYTFDKTTYRKDLTVSLAGANTRYSSTQRVNAGTYTFANARVGDFYCMSGSTGYLIPGDAISFSANMNCIGIVFKAGREATDNGTYTDIEGREMSAINGYVVALQDVSSSTLKWADRNGQYDFWVGTSTSDSNWQGYDNCQKMKNGGDWSIRHFPAANACQNFGTAEPYLRYAAPAGSSGWFLPSCGQLLSLYKNRDVLSGQINKLKAINGYGSIGWFSGSYYWSSSEYPYDRYGARIVGFGNGDVGWGSKNRGFYVRGVFAF
ncbi:fimbrillin family protein [Phocaeicola sartorii]|uniref:fimbrillin family protein n=1 Tax=Phocaeicola sartorii TaxID=671267 RepID=UPI00272B9E6C|nr:fimbrillin family protein [Phocaeicola sartorii]